MSENCTICQQPVNSAKKRTLKCGHSLHEDCLLDLIFNNDNKCPVCRKEYVNFTKDDSNEEVIDLAEIVDSYRLLEYRVIEDYIGKIETLIKEDKGIPRIQKRINLLNKDMLSMKKLNDKGTNVNIKFQLYIIRKSIYFKILLFVIPLSIMATIVFF